MKISWKTKIIKFMFHNRFRIKTKNKKQQKNAVDHQIYPFNMFFR